MNYYDMFGIKIRTKLDFDYFLYSSSTKSYDFEIVHDEDVIAVDILKNSEILYRRFVYGESSPCEEFSKVDGKYYLLRWLSQYYFFIDPEKRLLIVDGKLDGEFYCIFFSKILSFLLYLKGYSQLHGSAVRYRDKTICFIGESGSGKSTSASLCVMDGGKIITDDIIAFHPKDHMVRSGLSSLRLFSSSPLVKMAKQSFDEGDKFRVDFSNGLHYTETSVIDCFFFLEVNDEKGLSYSRLKGIETMLHLMSNAYGKFFLKNVFNEFLYTKNIPVFSQFSNDIPMFKVYRHSNTKPDELFALIQSLVSNMD